MSLEDLLDRIYAAENGCAGQLVIKGADGRVWTVQTGDDAPRRPPEAAPSPGLRARLTAFTTRILQPPRR